MLHVAAESVRHLNQLALNRGREAFCHVLLIRMGSSKRTIFLVMNRDLNGVLSLDLGFGGAAWRFEN